MHMLVYGLTLLYHKFFIIIFKPNLWWNKVIMALLPLFLVGFACICLCVNGLLVDTDGGGLGTSKMDGTACFFSRFVPGWNISCSKWRLQKRTFLFRYWTLSPSRSCRLALMTHCLDLGDGTVYLVLFLTHKKKTVALSPWHTDQC